MCQCLMMRMRDKVKRMKDEFLKMQAGQAKSLTYGGLAGSSIQLMSDPSQRDGVMTAVGFFLPPLAFSLSKAVPTCSRVC